MAEYKTIAPVDYVTGKLNKKDKTVFRQKFTRDSHGAVIRAMKKEVYVIRNPRDWKKNPAKGAEKVKQDRWAEACAKTKAILHDVYYKDNINNYSASPYATRSFERSEIRTSRAARNFNKNHPCPCDLYLTAPF